MTITLLLLVPLTAQAQSSVDLGSEIPLGAQIPSAAPDYQQGAVVARGTDLFLSAWLETASEHTTPDQIVARRLGADARPLSEPEVVVARGDGFGLPSISFGEGIYLVAFTNADRAPVSVRLDEEGRVLDPEPRVLALGGRNEEIQTIWNGTAFVVTWFERDENFTKTQKAVLVGRGGELLTPTPITFAGAYADDLVRGPNGETLLVWSDYTPGHTIDIFGARFGPDLQPIGESFPIIQTGGSQEIPDVAFDGQRYLVAWSDWRDYPSNDIRVAVMTTDGVIGESRIIGTHDYFIEDIDVVPTGTSFEVTWAEVGGFTVYSRSVDPAGSPIDAEPVEVLSDIRNDPTSFEVAGFADGVVTTADGFMPPLGENVYSVWSPNDSDPSEPILVSFAANGQRSPALASNGRAALVVWQDWRDVEWEQGFGYNTPELPLDLYVARVSDAGMDPARGRKISRGARGERYPDATWTGRRFLVTWEDSASDRILFRQIGASLDVKKIHAASGPRSIATLPRVAGARGRAYLVWRSNGPALMATSIDASARAGKRRAIYKGRTSGHDVTSASKRFVVVWTTDERDAIFTRAFSNRGRPLTKRRRVASASGALLPRIGRGQPGLLVSWLVLDPDEVRYDLFAMLVDRRGHRLTSPKEIGISVASPAEIEWDGDQFVVAWHGYDDVNDRLTLDVARLSASGEVVGRDTVAQGRPPSFDRQLGLAKRGGTPIVVYERHAPEPMYGGVNRIFLRAIQ